MAARVATLKEDVRTYLHGAIGVRKDGTLVQSYNGPAENIRPETHAERRLVRKLDQGSVVFVVRVKRDGTWGNSRPCAACEWAMRARRVKKVVYSIGPDEWGTMEFR
jgi:hypothetical protein